MKIKRIMAIVIFAILIAGATNIEQAANETNSVSNTQTNQNTNSTMKNTTTTTAEKSSNANLSNLGIKPHDFTGFRYGVTSYEVSVPEDTETVEVYAMTQDKQATVTGTGNKALEMGENKVEVIVTAEDGSQKTYSINITRGAKEDSEAVTKVENGLAKLKINDLSLSPKFKTNVYEYTVKYIGEDTKLEIETEATNPNYEVDVIGNSNLQEGENTITILVSESNGDNVATYQVNVNKSLVDQEAIAKEEAEKKENQQKIILGVVGAIVVIVAIVVVTIVIRKRNIKLEEEYSGRNSYDREEEEADEDEVPKALRGKRYQMEEQEEIEQEEEGMEENSKEVFEDEEEDFDKLPKDELKEKFLNGYTSQVELDFEEDYKEPKRKRKSKGKRFK